MDEKKKLKEQPASEESEVMTVEASEAGEDTGQETAEIPDEETEPQESELLTALKEYYPDATEENVGEMAIQAIKRLSGIQNKLADVAEEFPVFAMWLNDVMKGMAPDEAIARHFGTELTPPEGAPDWERINKRREEFSKTKAEKQARMDRLNKNRDISVENAMKFISDTSLSEEEGQKFLDWYDELHADMFDGLISPEHFRALYKGYKHDAVVAEKEQEAKETAETARAAGRNEQIEKKKMNAETGDGIPKLTSSGKAPNKKEKSYGAKFFDGVI